MDFSQPNIPAIGAVISGKAPVSSASFHREGKRLFVASAADSRLQVIDCLNGVAAQLPLKAEKEEIEIVESTHHDHCLLFAGKGGSSNQPPALRNAINYWSVHDNKLLRKFKGHQGKVTNISMCPADDTFLTSSEDGSYRLWNVQQAGCLAEGKLPPQATGAPIAAFDSTGLVFGVTAKMAGQQGNYLHLYDARNYSGAFAELTVKKSDLATSITTHVSGTTADQANHLASGNWNKMSFNQSGNQILIGADAGLSILLDGFEGHVQRAFCSKSTRAAVSCFTSDDKALLQGQDDGVIQCFDTSSGSLVKTLDGHVGAINTIVSNPAMVQVASSCKETALWCW